LGGTSTLWLYMATGGAIVFGLLAFSIGHLPVSQERVPGSATNFHSPAKKTHDRDVVNAGRLQPCNGS